MKIDKFKQWAHPQKLLLLALLLTASCVPETKLNYLNTELPASVYENDSEEDVIVLPGDELYIRVSSMDDVEYNFFTNQAAVHRQNLTNELSISLVTFTVNEEGYISYPITGDIFVKDKHVDQIAVELQDILKSYFNQPAVTVKKVNKFVTVLGEVRAPGKYTFTSQTLTIYEGLGLAGDITIHGNRGKVTLIREENGVINRQLLDMSGDDIITSPYYYLKSGDLLVVRSRKSALWSITASSISLILAFFTTTVVVLDYFQP
jgi:polysaccharide export outer membrane protein